MIPSTQTSYPTLREMDTDARQALFADIADLKPFQVRTWGKWFTVDVRDMTLSRGGVYRTTAQAAEETRADIVARTKALGL